MKTPFTAQQGTGSLLLIVLLMTVSPRTELNVSLLTTVFKGRLNWMQACFSKVLTFIDSEESTSFLSIAHIMEDLDHKYQITLRLSSTTATPYLCLVCFWSVTQRLLEKVAGLLKQKTGAELKFLHISNIKAVLRLVYLNTTCQTQGAMTPRNIVLWKTPYRHPLRLAFRTLLQLFYICIS